MKILRTIGLIVDWVLGFAFALGAIVWGAASVVTHQMAAEPLATLRLAQLNGWDYGAVMFLGIAVAVLNVAVVVDLVMDICCPTYLRLQTDRGQISVSTRVIQDAIKRAVVALDEVAAAKIRVVAPRRVGRPVTVRAHVTLRGGIVYHDVSQTIMSVIESQFGEIVSVGMPVKCQVFWEGVRRGPGEGPSAKPPQYGAVRPVFPVEEDNQEGT
jgi:hypothetical protein